MLIDNWFKKYMKYPLVQFFSSLGTENILKFKKFLKCEVMKSPCGDLLIYATNYRMPLCFPLF